MDVISKSAASIDHTDAMSVASSSVSSFANAQLIAATFGGNVAETATTTTPSTNITTTTTASTTKSARSKGVGRGDHANAAPLNGSSSNTNQNEDEEDAESAAGTLSSRDVTSIEDEFFNDAHYDENFSEDKHVNI
jgi:hypothetical protein